MRKELAKIVEVLLRYKRHIKYRHYFQNMMKRQYIDNICTSGEKGYIACWKRLYSHVEPYSYRFFRHYCGDSPYIVPEDIGHSIIEPRLNPKPFTPFYEDKNMLPTLLPEGAVPRTILCRICGGEIIDKERMKSAIGYNSKPTELFATLGGGKIILKPTMGSSSGRNILIFEPQCNWYVSHDGKYVLNGCFLKEYGKDWVIQEVIEQHAFMSHLCSSSVNTIRVNTYRSVKDEKVYILSAAVRIGHAGSIVDNLHQGGGLVGVDVETGAMRHEVLDQYGNRTSMLNGIDFAKENFIIPNWEEIKLFCKDIAFRNAHCRLIALDIAIREDGKPVLIEWNVTPYSFSYWIPMMTGVTPLGDKTEEIIEYCLNNK